MGITDDFCFSYSAQCLSAPRPAHRGRLRRRARVGAGCGVLRVRLVTAPPGGARQNRPSAITSGTRECANARPKSTAPLCNAQRFRQGGPGANNRRGGAPRGERSRWNARRPSWRLRAYVTRPPTGAAAPERLSALRFPHCLMRENGKPRRSLCLARTMTRARFVGRAKARLRAVPTRCV